MKKLIVVFFVFAVVSPIFAQNNIELPDLYYVNLHVERIYPSSKGYIVMYQKSTGELGAVGIPNEWFANAAGKAEIVRLPPGVTWPTLTVFYANGEFSHVRLYVHRSKSHQTWGNIPQGTDTSRFFSEDQDSLNIHY